MTYSILLTGATGYIGGSVFNALLESPNYSNYKISVIVRNEEAAKVFDSKGFNSILFKGLDDVNALRKAASEHDVVYHCADAGHPESAKALIQGLGDRKKAQGKEVYYIHTSGTSILGDHARGDKENPRTLSDLDDMYTWEKNEEEYDQRVVDIAVVETGIEQNVKTYIVIPPLIYGPGKGWFNKLSAQVPGLTKLSLAKGEVKVIGKGVSVWNHVEISDLAEFFELILRKILNGENVAYGKEGYYFVQSGTHSWLQVSQGIAKELKKLGIFPNENVSSISVEEVAQLFGLPPAKCEIVFASNSKAKDERARQLGWAPKREDFEGHFATDVKATLDTMNK